MEDLENLKNEYSPIIQRVIDDNSKFYQFQGEIKWKYVYNKDKGAIASCGSNLILNINIVAISFMKQVNEPLTLEFYILHEIRHLYQRLCVLLYKSNSQKTINNKFELWDFEFNNYVSMYKNIEEYYYQNVEFDAYSFSFAVMLYKYGKIDYIYPPHIYDKDINFHSVVNTWLNFFKNNKY